MGMRAALAISGVGQLLKRALTALVFGAAEQVARLPADSLVRQPRPPLSSFPGSTTAFNTSAMPPRSWGPVPFP